MTKRFLNDLVERVLSTFVQSFIAVFVPFLLAQDAFDLGLWQQAAVAAAIAGLAAALSAVKGLVASYYGDADSAGFDGALRPDTDTPGE